MMDIAEYYDSIASFWDEDYSEAKPARVVAATVSIPRGGACVLDVGCGSGSMFLDLLENGASFPGTWSKWPAINSNLTRVFM